VNDPLGHDDALDGPVDYGDAEPEDAYDASDPPLVQLGNVLRRLELALDDLHQVRARLQPGDDDG
jgi:hypothetical protein